MSRAAIFLDRDGTLIEDLGHLSDPAQAVLFPDTIPALRLLQRDFALFIVSNQSGIAKGFLTPAQVESVNRGLLDRLARGGIRIEKIYYCPHQRADGCQCIKPNPYYLHRAAREFDLDLARSFVIGDHPHDVELARNAGATGIYVLTGHGQKHRGELACEATVAAGIWDAALGAAKTAFSRSSHGSSDQEIEHAAALVKKGGVVAFPTETVYGLGANAYDAKAVARIFEIKGRPRFDPLIVHVAAVEQVGSLAIELPETARRLASAFWPGPLTLVLRQTRHVPDIVTAGLPTVGIRMPDHPVALGLIRQADVPLAAPSANPFGYISPTTARHVAEQLGARVDMILDGGPCRIGVESTIISLAGKRPSLLRAGGVPLEDIERIIGQVVRPDSDPDRPTVPGQLPSHYAPRTLLVRWPGGSAPSPRHGRVGLLAFDTPQDTHGFAAVEVLSPSGDLREAAANLFAALRRLDAQSLDTIMFQPVPEVGLGLAIMDRLRRASSRGLQRSPLRQ